jgi:hypothetical protein
VPEAAHATPGDTSFRSSVVRNLGGGVLLVAAVAALFAVIGMVGGDAAAPAAAPQDAVDPDAGAAEPDEVTDDEAGGTADPEGDAGLEDAGEPAPQPEPAEPDAAEPEEAEEPAPAPAIDPAEVSVQVLDGYREDGGAAADAVAAELAEAGYRIVARNPAILYSVTTVLYTAGNEAAGRQVAAELGVSEVREQPGNLSTAVAVHVVIGADRG